MVNLTLPGSTRAGSTHLAQSTASPTPGALAGRETY